MFAGHRSPEVVHASRRKEFVALATNERDNTQQIAKHSIRCRMRILNNVYCLPTVLVVLSGPRSITAHTTGTQDANQSTTKTIIYFVNFPRTAEPTTAAPAAGKERPTIKVWMATLATESSGMVTTAAAAAAKTAGAAAPIRGAGI